MTCIKNFKGYTLIFILFLIVSSSCYPSHISDSILVNSNYRTGKLNNGFSYFLKKNPKASKVDLQLIVKVGHINESRGQNEFAHITEHLGFYAGKNVSKEKSSKLFDKLGIQWSQISGNTRHNYTDFRFPVPEKNKEAIDVALLFFQDIIWNLELTPRSINKERISILNEAMGGELEFTQLLYNMQVDITGWREKLPDKFEIYIKNFNKDSLIKFYNKWYVPDRMALVVVGDFEDIDQIERDIIKKFSRPSPKSDPHFKWSPESYLHKKPVILKEEKGEEQIKNKELKHATIDFYIRQDFQGESGVIERFQNKLTRELLIKLINSRLNEKQQAYNKFYTSRTNFLDPPLALKLNLSTNGSLDKGVFQDVLKSLKQISKFGFTPEEFKETKKEMLFSISKVDSTENKYWLNEFIQAFINEKPIIPKQKELELDFIKNLALDTFNNTLKKYVDRMPEDLAIAAHTGHPILMESEQTLRNWITEVDHLFIEPYVSPEVPDSLISPETLNSLSLVAFKKRNANLPGIKEYILENGIRIVLNPLPLNDAEKNVKNSNIYFRGFTKKGFKCFPKEDYFSSINAPEIVRSSGVGGFNKFQLTSYLEEQNFEGYVMPYLSSLDSGFKGKASLKDFELALQVIFLYMSDPLFRQESFEEWKRDKKTEISLTTTPNENFINVMRETLPNDDFFPLGTKALGGLELTNFHRAMDIYKQVFQNGKDYTFIFTGNFPETKILELCRKYLGNVSVKELKSPKCQKDFNSKTLLKKRIQKIIPASMDLKSAKVRLEYIHPIDAKKFDYKEEMKMEFVRRSLFALLTRRLRSESKIGGIYRVSVGREFVKSHCYNELFIEFYCMPEDWERLVLESKEVVEELIQIPLDQAIFENIKDQMFLLYGGRDNYTEAINLNNYYLYEEPRISLDKKRKYINTLSPKDISITARKFLKEDPFQFILVPE